MSSAITCRLYDSVPCRTCVNHCSVGITEVTFFCIITNLTNTILTLTNTTSSINHSIGFADKNCRGHLSSNISETCLSDGCGFTATCTETINSAYSNVRIALRLSFSNAALTYYRIIRCSTLITIYSDTRSSAEAWDGSYYYVSIFTTSTCLNLDKNGTTAGVIKAKLTFF